MASTATGTSIIMEKLSITPLPSSIYETGSLTFVNNTNAYTTIDIN